MRPLAVVNTTKFVEIGSTTCQTVLVLMSTLTVLLLILVMASALAAFRGLNSMLEESAVSQEITLTTPSVSLS